MQTFPTGPLPMNDWLAEYNAWVEALAAQDQAEEAPAAEAFTQAWASKQR
jgi:hypothetical protein